MSSTTRMLCIESSATSSRVIPNLLPTKIHHDGPIDMGGRRYWNPQTSKSEQNSSEAETNSPPVATEHELQTAYFRGRKLRGRTVPLPRGYTGVVLQKTDRMLPRETNHHANLAPGAAPALLAAQLMDEDDEDGEDDEEDPYRRMLLRQQRNANIPKLSAQEPAPDDIGVLESQYNFDEMVIWGHEQTPDTNDAHVRAVQEWIAFAESIHGQGETSVK